MDASVATIRSAALASPGSEVQVIGLAPRGPVNGWIFAGEEIIERAQRSLPGTRITVHPLPPADIPPGAVTLYWDKDRAALHR